MLKGLGKGLEPALKHSKSGLHDERNIKYSSRLAYCINGNEQRNVGEPFYIHKEFPVIVFSFRMFVAPEGDPRMANRFGLS